MSDLLLMKDISKWFGSIHANDRITFNVKEAEVMGLLGENGAGKTTLMNILYGLHQPDQGQIFLRGHEVSIRSPRDAIRLRIGMIHQQFMLIPSHNLIENVILGQSRGQIGTNLRKRAAEITTFAEGLGMKIDPWSMVGDLSLGQQQKIEILKALYRGADILILDEPTSVLTPQESEELFASMAALRQSGRSCIFISHKLDELLRICDRISVLRKGRLVATVHTTETTKPALAQMMMGAEIETAPRAPRNAGSIALKVEDLNVSGTEIGSAGVQGLSFHVGAGEILGIGGVDGNGQQELAEALVGLREIVSGKALLFGVDVGGRSTRDILKSGVSYIPSDRLAAGVFLPFDLVTNLMIREIVEGRYSRWGALRMDLLREQSERLMNEYDIQAPSPSTLVQDLSGGNIQKVILARELMGTPRFLIASQPTRGLDVGATEYVRSRILGARDRGAAVLYISTELDELLSTCDRVMVLFRGRNTGTFSTDSCPSIPKIGLMMTGTVLEDAEMSHEAGSSAEA